MYRGSAAVRHDPILHSTDHKPEITVIITIFGPGFGVRKEIPPS